MTPPPVRSDLTPGVPPFRIPGGDDAASLRARLEAMQATLDAQQRRLDELASAVSVRPDGSLELVANRIEIRAASVALTTAMLQVTGVVRCDTLLANSVVASSYSPGAGNVW